MSFIDKIAGKFRQSFSKSEQKTEEPEKSTAKEKRVNSQKSAQSRSVNKKNYIANFDGLIDVVECDGKPTFLINDNGILEFKEIITLKGKSFHTPPIESTPHRLVDGESIIREFDCRSKLTEDEANLALFEDIIKYLKSISVLPSESHYYLCAAWILHTYRLEAIDCSPIIWFFGAPEHGKTRTGKGMILASYRGMHVESLNPAYILRIARDWGGSLFIDVVDIVHRAQKADSLDILLQRFQTGAKVVRVLSPEKGPYEDTSFFTVFGPTIIGTNRSVNDVLESRSIQIIMPEALIRFHNSITEEIALPLRAKLLAYRASYLGRSLPSMDRDFDGRFGELVQPLSQIVREVAPEYGIDLNELFLKLEGERLASKSESFDATILAAIIKLTGEVKSNLLPVKRITEKINEDRPDSRKLTHQKIGKVIKSLGLKTARATRSGGAALIWDEEKIETQCLKYGLDKTSETSESSENQPETDNSEVSDVSEPIDLPF